MYYGFSLSNRLWPVMGAEQQQDQNTIKRLNNSLCIIYVTWEIVCKRRRRRSWYQQLQRRKIAEPEKPPFLTFWPYIYLRPHTKSCKREFVILSLLLLLCCPLGLLIASCPTFSTNFSDFIFSNSALASLSDITWPQHNPFTYFRV